MKIAHIHVWDKQNKGDVGIVIAVQDLLKKNFPKCQIRNFPLTLLKKMTRKSIQEINKCDLVVIGGGGIFYHWFMPYDEKSIAQIKKPIVIFGVGYIREIGARKLTPAELHSIAFLVKKAKLVGVRERYTKKVLVKYGIPATKINVIGDPAVFLEEKPTSKLKFTKPVNIGLNLNYSGWMGFGQYQETILKTYQQVAKYFQEKHKANIYYLQHHPGEKDIYPALKIKDMKIVNIAPKEQKWVYRQLDLVVGMMLHSVVMTFGADTPFVCIGYDLRNKNFVRFINHPELNLPASELTVRKGYNLITKTFKQRKALQKDLVKQKKAIWNEHEKFLKKCKGLVK